LSWIGYGKKAKQDIYVNNKAKDVIFNKDGNLLLVLAEVAP
jgi:hypothetical protein